MKNNSRNPQLQKCNIEKHIMYAINVYLSKASSQDILRYLIGLYYILIHFNVGEICIRGDYVNTRSKQNILLSNNARTSNCVWNINVNIDIRNLFKDRSLYDDTTYFNILLHFLIRYKMGFRYLRKCNLDRNVVINVLRNYNADFSGYVIRLPIPFKKYLYTYLFNILKEEKNVIPEDAIFIINNLYDYVKPSNEHVRFLIEEMYKKDNVNYTLEFVLTNLNKWEHLKEKCHKLLYEDLTKHKDIYHALNINIRVDNRLYKEFINVDIETYYRYILYSFPINIAYYLECIAFFRFSNKIHFYEYFYIIYRYIERYITDNSIDLEWHYYITHNQCAYNLIIKLAQYYNIYVAENEEYPPITLTYELDNI